MDELVFQYLPIDVSLEEPFGLFTRPFDKVAILVRDADGLWLLGRKAQIYPDGIVRMLGGNMDQDEHPAQAARRELAEETRLDVEEDKLIPLIHAEITAHLPGNQTVVKSVFVFYVQVYQPAVPSSDITGLAQSADRDIHELVRRYSQLPAEPIDSQSSATWADYGQIWGPIHDASLARVKDLAL